MRFNYTARSTSGELSQGMLVADSLVQVQQQLREKGLFPVAIQSSERTAPGGGFNFSLGRSRVSQRELMALTSQLAIMARAGVDLAGAIETLARQCPNPAFKSALERVHADVSGGKSVSAALRNQVHIFGNAYVASVAAGEASGQLPEVLNRLAALQRSELKLKSTIRTLLAYPFVLATVSIAVIFGLMFFVLPQFADVFDDFDMPLPAITQFLLDISEELRTRFWLWAVVLAAGIGGLWWLRTSENGRRWWDAMMLNTIMLRDVTRALNIGRTFRLLGIMIESGVPLLDALRMARSSVQNRLYRKLFDDLEQEVLNGRGLGSAMSDAPFVPSAASQMISTAERTGTLGMVTRVMGEYYEEEGETRLRDLATILEPAIIIVMGVVVAFVVLSVMLPMFDFATLANKQ